MIARSTACLDWERRIVEGLPLVPEPIFPDQGEEALEVFKSLKMTDVPMVIDKATGAARYQTMGEVGADWLFDLVRTLFGAYDVETGRQLITEVFLLISKKNGKSTDAAAIMLTALIINWRHYQELTILSPTLEVANNAFVPARAMVKADEKLDAVMHIQEHLKTIKHRKTNAVLKVMAADSGTVSGSKSGFVLVDELWLFGLMRDADGMLREATGGLVARPEGFVIYCSTQSDKEPAGVFKTKLQYARDVRDGLIQNSAFLPVLYEYPDELIEQKAYLDPDYFYIPNPNIGRSVFQDWIEAKLAEVINATGGELQVFLAKHLNVEIGQRLSHDRWRGADYWEGAAEPDLTLTELLRRCEVAIIGIDGGGLDDLFGVAVLGREREAIAFGERETKRWLCWAYAICDPEVFERRKDIASRLKDFEDARELFVGEISEGMVRLTEIVRQVEQSGLMPEKNAVSIDPNNTSHIVDALMAAGVDCSADKQLHRQSQGVALKRPANMIPFKLKDQTFKHNGSSLMAWAVGNAKVEKRGNDLMITKQASGSAKIDPVIALMNAGYIMSLYPVAREVPKYQMFFV